MTMVETGVARKLPLVRKAPPVQLSLLAQIRTSTPGRPRIHDPMEIVQDLADGFRVKAIAARRHCSKQCLSVILVKLRRKHKVKTNAQLVAHYVRNGFID